MPAVTRWKLVLVVLASYVLFAHFAYTGSLYLYHFCLLGWHVSRCIGLFVCLYVVCFEIWKCVFCVLGYHSVFNCCMIKPFAEPSRPPPSIERERSASGRLRDPAAQWGPPVRAPRLDSRPSRGPLSGVCSQTKLLNSPVAAESYLMLLSTVVSIVSSDLLPESEVRDSMIGLRSRY